MKRARQELIDVLATPSGQFVWWETFVFQLAGGDVIQYTTRDADEVASGVFLSDTFTGNGTLATHVGEIGATWAVLGDLDSPLTDFVLTGNGGVTPNPAALATIAGTGLPESGVGDYNMSFTAVFPGTPTGGGALCGVLARGVDENDVFLVSAFVSAGQSNITVTTQYSNLNGADSNTVEVDTGIAVGANAVQFVMAVSNDRRTVTSYAAGAEVASLTSVQPLPLVYYAGINLMGADDNNVVMESVDATQSHTVVANQPIVLRSSIRTAVGVEVDTLALSLLVNTDVRAANLPLTQFALQGGFDGARLTVTRDFAVARGQPSCGSLSMFSGRVAGVNASATEIKMECKSDLELLNIKMPRNLFQAGCLHTLYDPGCALVAADFTTAANVAANSTRTAVITDLVAADGYYNLGVIEFTGGQNDGESRTVKAYTGGIVYTSYPFPYTPAANDTVAVRPGCDKLQATCNAKFDNIVHFRAFPFIPVPETSY